MSAAAKVQHELGSVSRFPCADCGGALVLRLESRGQLPHLIYRCTGARCYGMQGAHQSDGRPRGIPGDRATRGARIRAHAALDRLWKSGELSRADAYRLLRDHFELSKGQAHVSMFDRDMCERVIRFLREREDELFREALCGTAKKNTPS